MRSLFLPASSLLVLGLWAGPAGAQVTEVVVGVTPSCPYGLAACWGGAYEALGRLEGVGSVGRTPDAYNCTAQVHLKGGGLPAIEKWPEQFKRVVGKAYDFRGVEVTVKATVREKDGALVLEAPGLGRQVALGPLEHKLQWNFKKQSARQPEPDERGAYGQLEDRRKKAPGGAFRAEVTGPLRATDKGVVLEVREFFVLPAEATPP